MNLRRPLVTNCVIALTCFVSALATAQSPLGKAPRFHLPAGDIPVGQLIDLASQALRSAIRSDAATAEIAAAAPLHLQHELSLATAAWQDTVSNLLATRDLLLIRGQTGYEVHPAAAVTGAWLRERAEDVALATASERGAGSPVRVVVPTDVMPAIARLVVRTCFAGTRRTVEVDAVDGGVAIVGLGAEVRTAVAVVASLTPAPTADVPARRTGKLLPDANQQHRLLPGVYSECQLVDALADALGTNVVAAGDLTSNPTTITVATPIAGDARQFEVELTALLWSARVLILPLPGPHELREAVRLVPGMPRPWHRVQKMSVAELMARPQHVAGVCVHLEAGNWPLEHVNAVLRVHAKRKSDLDVIQHQNGYLLFGLSTDAVAFVQRLQGMADAKR